MTHEPILLQKAGAKWWHTDEQHMPTLSKASLGLFFYEIISHGAVVGEIFCLFPKYNRSWVQVSVYMTEEMKEDIEQRTRFRFRTPPKIVLNKSDQP